MGLTSAQRYNRNMDKIFARSEELGNHTLHGSTEKKHKIAKKMKDPYGLAKHRKMFDSPEHKKAVAKGKAEDDSKYWT